MASEELSQEQVSEWVREQYQRANKHLAEQGVLFESVATEECRYLAPVVAVWKIPYTAAKNAQESLRAFSMRWQLQAENILQSGTTDQLRKDFAQLLVSKAEIVYDLFANEKNWQ